MGYTEQLSEPVKAGEQIADDVGFIGKLIDDLAARQIADAKRVYIFGESRGGLMTCELMCRLAAGRPHCCRRTPGHRHDGRPTRRLPTGTSGAGLCGRRNE